MATGWDLDYRYEPNPLFQQTFVCLPFSKYKSPHLQTGDKIVMPPSSLQQIINLPLRYPLTFKIQTFRTSDKVSHCGVLEFEAEEGHVYMPDWMMDNLKISEGDHVVLRDASLPKACVIKLQPHTTLFCTRVPDPRGFLESKLSAFTCLSRGDTIMLEYDGKEFYYFDVVWVGADAVCLVDTDCDLDLETPLDYVEPKPVLVPTPKSELPAVEKERVKENNKVFVAFMGKGRRLDGMPTLEADVVEGMSRLELVNEGMKRKRDEDNGGNKNKLIFKAFTGRARLLG
ncbi:hypothetical protein CASFOL_022310 [Castilleja foliolosa]|uniref:Uncharacterized protein n=1 Tax=Castilleja foliolosa TaxID=1961234 RepID=A0ABD3CU75_9LAMI